MPADRERCRKLLDSNWEDRKEIIRELYLEKDKSLGYVKEYMANQHGFRASKAQYEHRLHKKWGFRKNFTKDDWRKIGDAIAIRTAEGKDSRVYNGEELIRADKVRKQIARYRVAGEQEGYHRRFQLPERVAIRSPSPQQVPPGGNGFNQQWPRTFAMGNHSRSATPSLSMASPAHRQSLPEIASPSLTVMNAAASDGFNPSSPTRIEEIVDVVSQASPHYSNHLASALTIEFSIPLDTLSFAWRIPLQPGGIQYQKPTFTEPLVEKFALLLRQESQGTLMHQPLEVVFSHVILYLLMNNFAVSEDPTIEDIFKQLHHVPLILVKRLMQSIAEPHAEALQQRMLLVAIRFNITTTVSALVECGLNMNQVIWHSGGQDSTPLELACRFARTNIVQILLRAGAYAKGTTVISELLDPHSLSRPNYIQPPRESTCPRDTIGVLTLLLEAGASISWTDLGGYHFWENQDLVDMYLTHAKGLITQKAGAQGLVNSAIMYLDTHRSTRTVKAILGHSFKADDGYARSLEGASVEACRKGNVELVSFFLEAGVQPGPDGLIEAVRENFPDVIHRLLQSGLSADSVFSKSSGRKFSGENIVLPFAGGLPNNVDPVIRSGCNINHDVTSPVAEALRHHRTELLEDFSAPCLNDLLNMVRWHQGRIMPQVSRVEDFYSLDKSTRDAPQKFIAWFNAVCEAGLTHSASQLLSAIEDSSEIYADPQLGMDMHASMTLAILGSHEEIVHMLLDKGMQPNPEHVTAALLVRNASLLRLLLDSVVDLRSGYCMLWAVRWGDRSVLEDLIKSGCNIKGTTYTGDQHHLKLDRMYDEWPKDLGMNPLLQAIHHQDWDIVQLLLDNGADPKGDGYTISPLTAAVQSGQEALVRDILSRGADPNDSDALCAATDVSLQMVSILLNTFQERSPRARMTLERKAIHTAISAGRTDIVRLMASFVDVNCLDEHQKHPVSRYDNCSPLGEAICTQNQEIIQILLECGGRVNGMVRRSAPYGFTGRWMALSEAIRTRNFAIVQQVCDAGADVNCPATLGLTRTPLQLAAEIGDETTLQFLLDRDAYPNAEPCIWAGGTALQLAAMKGFVRIAEILIENGANVNAPRARFEGRTAFEGAVEHGRMDMVLLLYHKGVDLVSDNGEQCRRAIRFAKNNNQELTRRWVEEYQREWKRGLSLEGFDHYGPEFI